MGTWGRLTTRRHLQPDRATQIRVVDLGSPGPASGFLASEMDEQSIDGAKEGVRLTSYSIVMYMLQSGSDGSPTNETEMLSKRQQKLKQRAEKGAPKHPK